MVTDSTRYHPLVLVAVLAALLGCKRFMGDEKTDAAAEAGVTTAAPTEVDEDAVCQVESHTVISPNVNRRTGLTASRLDDGRTLVGIGVGNHPHVVAFDTKGRGDLRPISLAAGSQLAKGVENGRRDLQRVTPILRRGGTLAAFADYRDKHDNGRRRIACGPAEKDDPFLVFDGTPVLKKLEKDEAAKKKPARRRPVIRLPGGRRPVPGTGGKVTDDRETLKEIRDCRTFSDPRGEEVWSAGSELVGRPQDDGTYKWNMTFFARRKGGRRALLFGVNLGTRPDKLHTFEAPAAVQLADGSFALTARYRGALYTWLLTLQKARKALKVYRDGYPGLPRAVKEGMDHLLLTSQKVSEDRWRVGYLRLTGGKAELPAALENPLVDVGLTSLAEPTIAKAGEQRWLAVHGGDRRRGALHVAPVDALLASIGKPFQVTPEGTEVYESHVFGLQDERLLAVYITRSGDRSALVADVLHCNVQSD